MESIFIPPDIAPVCAEQTAPLTQCSQGGYLFLMLTAYLFGGPKINSYTPNNNEQIDIKPETTLEKPNPLELAKEKIGSIFHPNKCKESDFILDPKKYSKYDEVPVWKFNCEQDILNHNFIKPKNPYTNANKEKENNDEKTVQEEKREEYDFIIVGAGSSGCVIANRLTENNYKVALIEAGPQEPDIASIPALAGVMGESNLDWKYRTQPDGRSCLAIRGKSCASTCGRVMGGSSVLNYLTYMRGNKRDYDVWAEEGNVGWSYKDVLPYFKKSENNRDVEGTNQIYHGVGGPLTVERFKYNDVNNDILVKAFHEKGLPITDFNGEEQIGTMVTQTTSKDGKRVSTNTAFIEPIRNRTNLYIKMNTLVTGIIIEPNQKVACGVTYIQDEVVKRVYARKEVIVSAGTYNSPKLLLASGVGPAKDLKKLNIPVLSGLKVGHNYQDHVSTEAMIMKLSNKTSTLVDIHKIIEETAYYYKTRYSDGILAQTGILGIVAFIRTPFALDKTAPDIQFHFDSRSYKEFYADPTTYLASEILPFSFYDGINVRAVLVAPESRGVVTLNATNPIFGAPLIHSGFLTKQRDKDAIISALNYAVKLEETQAFKENGIKFVRRPMKGCENYKWGTDEYFNCVIALYTGTIFHPAGTCKMGPKTDITAVVDPRLKVYGIKHLRVACNAVMRNIVRGNTNAPAIMIGEKASDLIKEDWQGC